MSNPRAEINSEIELFLLIYIFGEMVLPPTGLLHTRKEHGRASPCTVALGDADAFPNHRVWVCVRDTFDMRHSTEQQRTTWGENEKISARLCAKVED